MSHQLSKVVILSILCLTFLSGCGMRMGNASLHGGESYSSWAGNTSVNANKSAGNIKGVNGNISVGHHASAQKITLVNGNIDIARFAKVQSLRTINGGIDIDDNAVIKGRVKTTNGHIRIGENVTIGGDISLYNGDITIEKNSHIVGDIIIAQRRSWSFLTQNENTRLTLKEGVTVSGKIHLYKETTLTLPNSVSEDKVVRHY